MVVVRSLRDLDVPYVIVDMNPENVRVAVEALEPAFYGDVTSPEVLEHLGIRRARCLAVAINDPDASARAVRTARSLAPGIHLVARVPYLLDVTRLERAGADEIVVAEVEAAVEMNRRVLAGMGIPAERVEAQASRIREEELPQ
jgi:CPA2 family monovalent cation:H+ antiporter-2